MAPRFTVIQPPLHETVYHSLSNQTELVLSTLLSLPTTIASTNHTILNIHDVINATFNMSANASEKYRTEAASLMTPVALPGFLLLISVVTRVAYSILVILLSRRLMSRKLAEKTD